MPAWWWAGCGHLRDACPAFLRSALHLHAGSLQQADDFTSLLQRRDHNSHPLDSQLTTDVLRYVAHCTDILDPLCTLRTPLYPFLRVAFKNRRTRVISIEAKGIYMKFEVHRVKLYYFALLDPPRLTGVYFFSFWPNYVISDTCWKVTTRCPGWPSMETRRTVFPAYPSTCKSLCSSITPPPRSAEPPSNNSESLTTSATLTES